VALKLRGLPFQIANFDIVNFFYGYSFIYNTVLIGKNNDGKKNGYGILLFENEQECQRAMSEKQGKTIGPRYIEI
jgi:hypothetical protein